MSSSSMTTHMFVLSEETDEEREARLNEKPSWVSFSRFLPAALALERSAIRLNVQEEVSPPQPFRPPNANQKSPKNQDTSKEYPYVCFVETTGLLVVISCSGYCCKFSIELEDETPVTDLRTVRYNNKHRIGSRSPVRARLSLNTGQSADEPDSLAKSITPGVMHSQTLNQTAINNIVNSSLNELANSKTNAQSGARNPLHQS